MDRVYRVVGASRRLDKDQGLMERGFHNAGEVENRLGYRVGQLGV